MDMRILKLYSTLAIAGALLLTSACQTTEKKRAAAAPPLRATAPTLTASTPAPPKIDERLATKDDPVEALLKQVESEYESGRANYAAGHLEAAKANFDRAFNLLLQGPAEVRSDERLERKFEQIVEDVHSLDLVALKEGDGFTEQRSEPAPIDEANDITFPVDPSLKAKAEAELKETHSDLPLVMNDEVAGYVNYFSTRGRGTVERALSRAGRYREMILRTLKEEGVPQELIYLAQAESGFQPLALSRAGARGMWQFMAGRAKGYDLQRNWWVDERQDPEKSTRAAARHLKDLYKEFGDWYLAMAAYNSGPGTVQAAVRRTGYADFWQLYRRGVLPKETRNYVPIIMAVTIMAKNPVQYGLESVTLEQPPEVDRVTINYPVDLRLVAECVETSVSTLRELNSSLLRMTTPKDGRFELKLPAGSKEKFLIAIAAIPKDMRVWWRYHKVAAGDTLGSIAKKYKTTAKAIVTVNNLEKSELATESKLIIPVTPGKHPDSEGMTFSRHPTRYKVRKGDTVLSVAEDFSVPVERLRRWNGLKGNQLRAGRTLVIYRPVAAEMIASSTRRTSFKSYKNNNLRAGTTAGQRRHKVKSGETLHSIASAYNTSVAALRRDNGKVAANLRAGDVLVIRSSH